MFKTTNLKSILHTWSRTVRTSDDWHRFAIALVSGVLSVLALAPFFFWPILFVTIPNLVWLIDGAQDGAKRSESAKSAALNGWLFGFGYFSAGLFWVGEAFLAQSTEFVWALPFAVTLLPAGLALFFAAATATARFFWWPGLSRVLVLAATLASAEWLRGNILSGFPWNLLGYAFTAPLELMQTVSLVGVYSLSFWVVLLSALPAVMILDAGQSDRRVFALLFGIGFPLAVLASSWVFGHARLNSAQPDMIDGVKVRIVQPSIPQNEKWVPGNRGRIFDTHLRLSGTNPQGVQDNLAGISHVVWPEVALPFLPLEIPEAMRKIGAQLPDGTFLITGGLRREPKLVPQSNAGRDVKDVSGQRTTTYRAYNSMLVFDDAGNTTFIYDKIHLVPFGEYLPFQSTLEAIGLRQLTQMRGGFTSGRRPRPNFDVGRLRSVAGLICYEVIFPGAVLQGTQAADRPSLFINLTNDGWFGNTTGPQQHFHQARVRAVETGIPIVRAANNGISAVFDPAGRVVQRLDLNARGTLDSAIPQALSAPIYARFGDFIFFLHLLCFFGVALVLSRKGSP